MTEVSQEELDKLLSTSHGGEGAAGSLPVSAEEHRRLPSRRAADCPGDDICVITQDELNRVLEGPGR
jgi:hypothetical protein